MQEKSEYREKKLSKKKFFNIDTYLSKVFNNAAVGMGVLSFDGNFLKINNSFSKLIGYSEENLLQMMIQDITYPKDYYFTNRNIRNKLLPKKDKTGIIKLRFIHEKGNILHIRLTTTLINDENNNPLYLFIQVEDITKRMLAQEQLIQREKLHSIGLLAAGIAHEINNPIMGIINYASIIKDELKELNLVNLNIKPFSFIDGLLNEAKRISRIIDGLSKFAHRDTGKFVYSNMAEIIYTAISLIIARIKNSQIELQVNLIEDTPNIPIQPQKIQLSIINILQNSIDALNIKEMENKRKLISINTSLTKRQKRQYYKITIKDNGQGIKQKYLKQVLDPFFTTKIRHHLHRVGLGLSIVYGIIRNHDGLISIRSKWKEYTIVDILLPLKSDIIIKESKYQ
ncbi:MAG: nitrogen regulation protein NR(II) [Promethearchaeota archaeon]